MRRWWLRESGGFPRWALLLLLTVFALSWYLADVAKNPTVRFFLNLPPR